ncbi:MAG: histidine phosphatase family protein [Actinobacteria bacterium]|nr:histidine phosphatase family protein [Actinomycetota bacterium]
MELLLIRHAEPLRVGPGETGGEPVDPSLTVRGAEQARRLADWLVHEPIDRVLTSPMRRAVETAMPLCTALGVELEIVDGLVEYDANADHYIPVEEMRVNRDDRFVAMVEGRWEEYGGEQPDVFRARIVPALEGIIGRFPGGRVAVVCHGGVINVYLGHLLGIERHLWFEPGYASVSRVAASRLGHRSVVTLNETAHLLGRRDGG